MNTNRMKDTYKELIWIISIILVYLYVNPIISLVIGCIGITRIPSLIYHILIISPLIENTNILTSGFTISKLYGVLYAVIFIIKLCINKNFKIILNKYTLLIYIYMILGVFGTLIMLDKSYVYIFSSSSLVVKESINMILRLTISLFLCIDFSNKKSEDIKNLILALCETVTLSLIIVCIYNLFNNVSIVSWGYERKIFTNSDPNEYSGIISSLIIFPLYLIYLNRKRILAIFSIILSCIIILQTMSRGGIASLLMVFLLSVIFIFKDISKRLKIIFGSLLCIIFIIIINPDLVKNIIDRIFEARGNLKEFTGGRFTFWMNGIKSTAQNSLFIGYGPSNTSDMYVNYINGEVPIVMHSIYVSIFVKYGLVGISLFVYIIATIVKGNVKVKKYTKCNIYLLIFITLIVLLFMGISLSWDYDSNLWNIIGINLGIVNSIIYLSRKKS